jgi:putative endonuclease
LKGKTTKKELSREPSDKSNTSIGKKGEMLALQFLIDKEYQLIETNYRSGKAEIDLIVEKGNCLVFVEVKYRSSLLFGYPESFVSQAKQKRIIFAAEKYIFQKNWMGNIRFDIVAIVDIQGNVQIEHFKDCF